MVSFTPIPEELPTGPPSDYQNIQTNPTQFGVGVAQAGEQVAGEAQKSALEFQQIRNETDALNATTDASKQLGDIETQFRQLRGTNAVDQLPQYQKKVQDLQAQVAQTLPSPMARMQFLRDYRSYADRTLLSMGSHSGSEAVEAHVGALTGAIQSDQSLAVRTSNIGDIEPILHSIVSKTAILGQSQGWEQPQVEAAVQKNVGDVMHQIVVARLGANDGASAKAIFDKAMNENVPGTNLPLLDGAHQAMISQELKSYTIKQDGRDLADEAFGAATAAHPPQPTNPSAPTSLVPPAPLDATTIVDKGIWKQESGGRTAGVLTSQTGAVGPLQIQPDTFKLYTMPGERLDINKLEDQKIVAQRIADDGLRRSGGNPLGAAVAYFSGANNVASAGSPTPWKEDRIDPTSGLRTSEYVRQVAQKLGLPAPSMTGMRAAAYDHINSSSATEEVKQAAREEVNQRYQAEMIANAADERARKDANEQAALGYVQILHSGDQAKIAALLPQIRADTRLNYETMNSLANAAEQKTGNDIDKAAEAYGPGFWDTFKKVTAPVGSPDRIGDINDILRRAGPGGDLTLAGAEKLTTMMRQNQSSVNDTAVNQTKLALMSYVKGQMSFEDDTGFAKIRDPVGERMFNAQFIPKVEAAYDSWVKAGKSPWEFLTQKNFDEIAKPMMRSKKDMAAQKLAAIGEAPGGEEPSATNTPPPPMPTDEQGKPVGNADPDGWAAVASQPPVVANGQPFNHAAWGKALAVLLKDPTPQTFAAFNSHFGQAGLDGATLYKQMTTKPEQPGVLERAADFWTGR